MADCSTEFSDFSALVTGAASGIGRATSLLLASRGARILALDRDEEGAEQVVAEIRAEGGEAQAYFTDLASAEEVQSTAKRVLVDSGPPNILVNAAGWDLIRPFVELEEDELELLIAINLTGPMRLTRALLPEMLMSSLPGISIVNIASDAGRVGSSGETVYAGAKGGIIAFTKSLARETARAGARVNCVCPGPTDTPLFASLPENLRNGLIRAIPFRRLATPEEVAEAIAFFASPRSSYVTGQVLSVSGGLTMAG